MARRMDWAKDRERELTRLRRQQEHDLKAYSHDLDRKRYKRPLPIGPNKAQLREELERLAPRRELPPWGAWSPWKEVIGRHGNVYWERSCSRVGHERSTNQEHGGKE